jgi:hypothetical protein
LENPLRIDHSNVIVLQVEEVTGMVLQGLAETPEFEARLEQLTQELGKPPN